MNTPQNVQWPKLSSVLDKVQEVELKKNIITRKNSCSLCGSSKANLIASVDFWNLQRAQLAECTNCYHIQFDPMLTEEQMEKGCTAYYVRETHSIPPKERTRNYLRNYRRGVAFAKRLQSLNVSPQEILEFGPGDGHFLQGVRYVFPNANISVLDIVEKVLTENKEKFGYKTYQGQIEDFTKFDTKFDLIIGRDIIEHLANPTLAINNVVNNLNPGGFFHFITPNGIEDVWRFLCLERLKKHPNENITGQLLLNHINYFRAPSLRTLLVDKLQLQCYDFYLYGLKGYRRGYGRKLDEKLSTSRSQQIDYKSFYEIAAKPTANPELGWLTSPTYKPLVKAYCLYKDLHLPKLAYTKEIGHKIYGLFQKPVKIS